MLQPKAPPYDIREWRTRPFPKRMRWICQAWATQGYGTPPLIYTVYLLKIALLYFGGGLVFFCSFTPGLGNPASIASWAFDAVAFQKAVLWTMAYEGLGLGCGSGRLHGPLRAAHRRPALLAAPGTTKLPLSRTCRCSAARAARASTWRSTPRTTSSCFACSFRRPSRPRCCGPPAVLLPVLGLADERRCSSRRAPSTTTRRSCASSSRGRGSRDARWCGWRSGCGPPPPS